MSTDGHGTGEERQGVVRACGYGVNTGSATNLGSTAPTPTRGGMGHMPAGLATPGSQEQARSRMRSDSSVMPTGAPHSLAVALGGDVGGINYGGGNFGSYGMPPSAMMYNYGYNAGYGMPPQQAAMQMAPQMPPQI